MWDTVTIVYEILLSRIKLTCVEVEVVQKHAIAKPDLCICVQEMFVIVICHTTSVLNLANHITNCVPGNTLDTKQV